MTGATCAPLSPTPRNSRVARFGPQCSAHIYTITTEHVEGVDEISADYDLRVVGRLANLFGRYGPFATDAERTQYVEN